MEGLVEALKSQGIWAILFGYALREIIKDKGKLYDRLDRYDSSLNQISKTLESMNIRLEHLEDKGR